MNAETTTAPTEWLDRRQAAEFLTSMGVSVTRQTLASWACHQNARHGPSFYRTGWRTVRYRREELITWAQSRMRKVE